ncbi:LexA repressor [Xylophilus ampelinus]|nr:peptidase S24 [Variovorax sp.]VTY36536.1 LexA repressor [Xylophilus ampelinus]|tara:strand:- start:393 stop:1034 length:642 start_codon:yes stop_codon:yes gene_type:complete
MARPNHDAVHLRRLRDTYARMGCLPSYSQMAMALGFKAKNAAFKLTQRLIASGHVTKVAGGRLAPGPSFFTLELSDDEIRAGFGAESSATGVVQAQALDQILLSRPSKTVFVKVRGESMVDAGILSGDVAAVQVGLPASDGDIVVAEIDGRYTIKEFRRQHGHPRLVAHGHGGSRPSMVPTSSLTVVGVVTGIVRNYRSEAAGRALATRGTRR